MSKKVEDEHENALAVFEHNVDCEKEIIKVLATQLAGTIPPDQITIEMATLQTFDKILVKHLKAFYRCRVQEDILQSIKLPTKGNIVKVTNN